MSQLEKLKKRLLEEERKRSRRKNSEGLWLRLALTFVLVLLSAAVAVGVWYKGRELWFDYQLRQTETLLEEGRHSEAADRLVELQAENPWHEQAPELLFRAAELNQLFLREYEQALLYYLLVEKDYPGSDWASQARRRVADIYMERLHNYNEAIIAYQALLDQGVADAAEVQYRIAEAYFRLNNFEQARIEWEMLLKAFPESAVAAESYYRVGVSWSLQAEHDQAHESFEAVVREYPDSPFALEARFALAGLHEERGELRVALSLLEELVGSYPREQVLEQRLTQVRERLQRREQGEAEARP